MLKEKIKEDLKMALKGDRTLEVSTLRMVLAAILEEEKKKRYALSKENPQFGEKELEEKSQLSQEEIIQALVSGIKKRREAILEFEKGKRQDLADKEKEEIGILQYYLPQQLSEKEIEDLACQVIKETGVKEARDMGRVMADLMPKIKGKADGATVSRVVKKLLAS